MVFQGCHKAVSMVFQVFLGVFKSVLLVSQRCFQSGSDMSIDVTRDLYRCLMATNREQRSIRRAERDHWA